MYFCQIPTSTRMRFVKFMLPLLLLLPALFSCNKDLNVNAGWKDITVVYGLLDQSADTTFIKITKAFLGPGDALTFSKIADSSIYPGKLEVRLDVYNATDSVGTIPCDTITIHNKQKGDSIFYYPDQLMYYTKAKLSENYTYKLFIRNKVTGKVVTSQPVKTQLIHDFEVTRPQVTASFIPGEMFEVRWSPATNAKRYQVLVRFYYQEYLKSDPLNRTMKSVDWLVDNKIMVIDPLSTQLFDQYFPSDAFYAVVGGQIKVDSTNTITRYADHCDFIFSVADVVLNTYMEVTEPSQTIVQEKPAYTNITNGLGIFSARYTKRMDSLGISTQTRAALRTNEHTKGRGF